MSYNKISILGFLGRDPELRYTQQGKPVCNFSVATTEKWQGRDGQQEKTVWFRIIAWGKMAENANKYLSKGREVYVEGRLSTNDWTDRNNQARTDLEVNATEIQFIGGSGNSGGKRDEMDQRRPNTDDHDQRYSKPNEDALPLGNKVNPLDDVPF